MKIAFTIFRYFPFGGIQRDFMRIAELCAKRGHELHLFTLRLEGPPADFPLQVHIVPVTARRNHHRYEQFAERVRDQLARDDYDLVVGFNKMPGLDAYFQGDPCFIDGVRRRRSALYRLGGRYRVFRRFERAVFGPESGTEILLLSEFERERYQRWYETPAERFHLLPPSVSADRVSLPPRDQSRANIASELGFASDSRIVLMIGSDFRRKGLSRAVRAMAALPEQVRRSTHLLVAGHGRAWPYRLLAQRLGVADRVHLLQGRSDVPALLAAADLQLHVAVEENTGMAIVEGLAAGLPVLATGECGYAPHVERSGAGRVVPVPFQQDALNRILSEMLVSPKDQHEKWRANARKYARETDLFSGPQRAAELIEQFAAERSRSTRPMPAGQVSAT